MNQPSKQTPSFFFTETIVVNGTDTGEGTTSGFSQPNSLLPLLTLSFLSYFDIYHMNLAVHISALHREPNPQERGIQSAPESPAPKLGHRAERVQHKMGSQLCLSGSIGVTQPRLETG